MKVWNLEWTRPGWAVSAHYAPDRMSEGSLQLLLQIRLMHACLCAFSQNVCGLTGCCDARLWPADKTKKNRGCRVQPIHCHFVLMTKQQQVPHQLHDRPSQLPQQVFKCQHMPEDWPDGQHEMPQQSVAQNLLCSLLAHWSLCRFCLLAHTRRGCREI